MARWRLLLIFLALLILALHGGRDLFSVLHVQSDHDIIIRTVPLPKPKPKPLSAPKSGNVLPQGLSWSLAPNSKVNGSSLNKDGNSVQPLLLHGDTSTSFLGHGGHDWLRELRDFRRGKPLISVNLPTSANRQAYFEGALNNFLRQDYPNKELVVLSSRHASRSGKETEDILAFWQDAAAVHDNVRYEHLDSSDALSISIGAKHNTMIEMSKGTYIASFDDDDIYDEQYLSRMTEQLILHRADLVKPGRFEVFLSFDAQEKGADPSGIFVHTNLATEAAVDQMFGYGFGYVYRRAAFQLLGCRYPPTNFGEDFQFVREIAFRGGKAVMLGGSPSPGVVVKVQHGDQTSQVIYIEKSTLPEMKKHDITALFVQAHHLRNISLAATASNRCKYWNELDTRDPGYLLRAKMDTTEECCALCRVHPKCFGFTHSRWGCFLKTSQHIVGGTRPSVGIQMGSK